MHDLSHESFTLTRRIAARPDTVFRAWADPTLKRRWFVDSDGPEWTERDYSLDFRVGGTETGRFILNEGPGKGEHRNVTHYLDIEPGQRIVFAYTMALDGRVHSASLTTVTLADDADGTLLTYTEQMTLIGPSDGAAGRRHGWEHLLAALETELGEHPDA